MLLIQRLAWLAFQGSIVVFMCITESDFAALEHRQPNVGHAITAGMLFAYCATLFVSVFLDAGMILWGKITGKSVAPKHRRGPAPIAPPRRSFGSPW